MAAENNWQKVDEIYRLALEQDAGRRAEFLREACAGDDTLRAEVDSLLGYDGQAGSFLEPPEDPGLAHSMVEGEIFAHYRILEKLGQGGMGVVYKARDTRLNRVVAIKMLPRRLMALPERRARFAQEARAASALNHPNIVTIYEISEADGRHFISMEYVEGSTLEKLIPRKGMRIADALRYAIQIAEALGCAHSAGVIHRDLKPGNIMVTPGGQVKVVDFGLAKLTETKTAEAGETETLGNKRPHTEEGTIVGTVAYMSPEQAEGKPLDSRSDIFSFGAVLYEMVTGQRAFHGDTVMSTVAAILHKEPKAASETRRAVSRDLEKIINRCLRKDPERRFQDMADLKVALMELKEASESGVLSALAAKKRNRKGLLWASAVLLLAAAASLTAWLREKNDVSPQPVLIATPLTTYPGSESMPSFSPDGNQIAFVWDGQKQDNRDIYIKLIGGGSPIRLTTDPEPDVSPAWSPDGGSIAFWRVHHSKRGMRGELFLIPALGGPERKLLDVPLEQEDDVLGSRLEWSPDSRNLFYASPAGAHGPPGLFLLSIATGDTRRLTEVPAAAAVDDLPAMSPDGRTLAFIRRRGGCFLYLLALSEDYRPSGPPQHVAAADDLVGRAVWVPDSHEIVYQAGIWPERLWKVDATRAGRPQLLAFAGEGAREPAVSRQGHRLAYSRWSPDLNIWRMDVSRGAKTGAAMKLIASTRQDANPSFSPDGKKVAFASNRSGHYEIWVSNSDGSSPVQLTFRLVDSGTPRWFPDGRRIVFDSSTEQREQIYAIDAAGGVPQRMTNSPDGAVSPSVSPDGKWIYFSSHGTGVPQVWRVPVAGGPAEQITRDGGFGATPSPDGAFLYYQKSTDVWRMPAEGGNAIRVVLGPVRDRLFAIGRNGIYFIGPIAGNEQRMALQFQDAVSGTVRQIRAFEKPPWYWGISLSPDERFLLYTQMDAGDSDLMLVENFR